LGTQTSLIHPSTQRLKRATVSQQIIVHNFVCPKVDPFSITGDPIGMSINKWTSFGTELQKGRIWVQQRVIKTTGAPAFEVFF